MQVIIGYNDYNKEFNRFRKLNQSNVQSDPHFKHLEKSY